MHFQTFQISLRPTWVIGLLLILFHGLSYVSYSLSLPDTLNPPWLHFDLQPSILTSVTYPQFQTPSLTSYVVADTVGTPQPDL